jgi:hypothetical protein
MTSERRNDQSDENQETDWRNLLTPFKKSLFTPEHESSSRHQTSNKKQHSDMGNSKFVIRTEDNNKKFENSLEDLKVSSSDANANSLMRNCVDYSLDDKENSILNHPNVVRSRGSDKPNSTSDELMELSKSHNNLQISNFLGSMPKLDEGFAEKINILLQGNGQSSVSSHLNASKNHKDLEMMLRTQNQSNMHNINDDSGSSKDIYNLSNHNNTNSFKAQELLDGDESFLKSVLQSSSRKQKRNMIRDLMSQKGNAALRAKTKLLMSSYLSDDGSPGRNSSKNNEDDLKFSQTKMDQIVEENEDQENEFFDNFINDHNNQDYKGNKRNSRDGKNGIERYMTDENTNKGYNDTSNESNQRKPQRDNESSDEEISPQFTPEI